MTARGYARRLRAGVIAAGRGERLRADASTLKPLVPIAGRPLVERVLVSLAEAEPSEVVIIVNDDSRRVIEHVAARDWPFLLRWIVETTPSSMHSFLRVLETLEESRAADDVARYLISTVDTIAPPGAYAAFVAAGCALDADVVLAVTAPDAGADDKPLLVRMNATGSTIDAIGESVRLQPDTTESSGRVRLEADDRDVWMTAGYYVVRPSILREADAARRGGVSALRGFLARLVAGGYRVAGVPVAAGVDVDHPRDVRAAEALLRRV